VLREAEAIGAANGINASGALGLDSSRDGCGGAANSWGGGGLALDLNLRHSAGNRRFPGSVPPLVYVHVQCMHVRVQTAARLVCHFVIEERCIHMSIQCTFFTRKPSLVPRLLRRTTPLRTLPMSPGHLRLSRTLASTWAVAVAVRDVCEIEPYVGQNTMPLAREAPRPDRPYRAVI
jgi:hypothetical protein